MPTTTPKSPWSIVLACIFTVSLIAGCGGRKEGIIELDENDPYLVEPASVTDYVPQNNADESELLE